MSFSGLGVARHLRDERYLDGFRDTDVKTGKAKALHPGFPCLHILQTVN
jgi:hypothetical protein